MRLAMLSRQAFASFGMALPDSFWRADSGGRSGWGPGSMFPAENPVRQGIEAGALEA